ncbi:MAG: porin [Deltaproteobacteria bacterium]|nr:porin [Deltaproteobacteria bacterium]
MRIQERRILVLGMAFILICVKGFWGVALAGDDDAVNRLERIIEAQQQQIEAQAKALAALQARMDQLTRESSATREILNKGKEVVEATREEAEGAKREADMALRKVEAIDPGREEDRMLDQKFMHFEVPKTETVVTVSGFAKGSVIHDFDGIASPTEFITSAIVVDGKPSDVPGSRTTFTANDSRFVIGSATPTGIGRLSTFISADFFGNTDSTSPKLRLRQAFGQLDDFFLGGSLRVGQSWSTWDDVPGLPETLDFQGPNGSQQTRKPLVRWARDFDNRLAFWAAIENPDSSIENGNSGTRWPDGVLALNYLGAWGHLKPAILFRDVCGEASGSGMRSEFGWGASLSSRINLPILGKKDNLKFQLVYGRGIGSYMNEDGVNDGVLEGAELKLLPVFSGFGAVQHWWMEGLRSNAVFGWVDVGNQDAESGSALSRSLYLAGNLIWSPVKQMDIGGEFLWGQRKNRGGARGAATRIQFSAKYKF